MTYGTKTPAAPLAVALTLLSVATAATGAEARPLVLEANMKVLRCAMPDEADRFVGSTAPGQVFFADEPVTVHLSLTAGGGEAAIEIQEITTRDPAATIPGVFTDTAGEAPLIGREGKPVRHALRANFAGKDRADVTVKNLPVPKRFGTYALVLVRGGKR